jgi:hypothetical protein
MKNLEKTHLGFILTLLFFAQTSMAKTTDFTVLQKKVSFDLPSNWEVINKEVGVPLKLMGPIYEGRRPVLLFVPLDVNEEKLIVDDKAKAEESYKIGRMGWLQTTTSKLISFLPMKTFSTDNNKIEFHQFGYLYQYDGENLEEKSFYVKCKGKVFHMKSLIQVEHIEKLSPQVKKIIDSFRCE